MATQLITPNPEISCTPGLCLVYVRETFGIPAKYPTAVEGWAASSRKHADQAFPADVWVPLWFSVSDNPGGHVVLRQPDGSIWSASDPEATSPIHHGSLAELESYYGGRLTYLGWTEDIEDVVVVDGLEPIADSKSQEPSGSGQQAVAPLHPSLVSIVDQSQQ